MQGIHTPTPKSNDGWATDLLVLTLGLGLLLFLFLGPRPLFVPDEGRYAEIAREMAVSGDFITPTLNGIKYFEKPALFYWLGAAVIKFAGINITALRMINAVIALLGCLLTYAVGRQLFNRATGIIASIILGTSTLYFVMAHMISLDLPVTVFIAASLYGFLLATQASTPKASYYLYGAAIAAALAVLTKGLIGIVFPAMIVTAWLTLMNEWRQLKRLPIFSAFALFLVVATPWHLLVNYYNPEFFRFYFIEQHFLRYATPGIGHYQPAWFFIPILIAGFFPWIAFLPQTIATALPRRWQDRQHYACELFFCLWAILIFTFFSFSKSKLIPYLLPILPALALLTGRYVAAQLQHATRSLYAGYACLVLLSAVITYYLWNLSITVTQPVEATLYLRASLVCLLIGAILSMVSVIKRPLLALSILTLSASLFLVISHASVRFIDTRTIQPLAMTLKPLLRPGDEVITYNQYYQDLPFYLGRKVTILNWRNELTFGMEHQDTEDWMIDDKKFWDRWHSPQRVFMIMSKEEYQRFQQRYPGEIMVLISETQNNTLVTNLPLVVSPT